MPRSSLHFLLALSFLLWLSHCDSSSEDDEPNLTPLRDGQGIGSGTKSAFDGFPVFNSDGSKFAYISGRAIEGESQILRAFLIDLTSETKEAIALSDGSHGEESLVGISPGQGFFAIATQTGILLGDLENTDRYQKFGDDLVHISKLAFSPNGEFLAYYGLTEAKESQLRVVRLPTSPSALSPDAEALPFSSLSPGASAIQFLELSGTGPYSLIYAIGQTLFHCDFSALADSLCEPTITAEGIPGLRAASMAADGDRLIFASPQNVGDRLYPVSSEGGTIADGQPTSLPLTRVLQVAPWGQAPEVLSGSVVDLGFDISALGVARDSGLIAGVFAEGYYCEATGAQLQYGTTLKVFDGVSIRRIIPVVMEDGTYTTTDNLCFVPPQGASLVRNGIVGVALASSAELANPQIVFQGIFTGNDELFSLDASGVLTAIASNAE